MVRAIGRRAAVPVLDGERRRGGLLGLSTGCDWSLSGHSSKLDSSLFLCGHRPVERHMLYCCHSAPAQHMLQLKVRDVQSKMPEINTSHMCTAGVQQSV